MFDSPSTPSDVAIIGMACIFPGAPDLSSYWRNIVERVDAVGDPPDDWRADLFFEPASQDGDRVYCKRGGYLRDLAAFNPLSYGVMPSSIDGGEPDHFLALRVAYEAMTDAGYQGEDGRVFDSDRVEVILGRGVYINRAFTSLVQHSLVIDQTLRLLRQLHPEHDDEDLLRLREQLKASLPAFNAEIAPGLVPNILSGRIANRLDLKGPNFTIDAACASSLIAVERAAQDLLAGRCDMALVGGVQCSTPAPIHMIFCQLDALSRRGTIRPFAEDADGTVLGEGLGMMVLKRGADAQRDGDRVYAVIKGIGTASDGRALGLLAPRPEGQEMAMRRAYDAAAIEPSSIGLLEAHGTGTAVGDQTEAETLARLFGRRDGQPPRCALGSVKSMIGHLLPAAGIAGLIKAALALHYKILPPTLHCEVPNPKLGLDDTPLYVNTETRAWVHGLPAPRRAGVNAFGFGGINAHAILEEAPSDQSQQRIADGGPAWDSEVVILRAPSRSRLIETCRELDDFLGAGGVQTLADIAYTVNCADDLDDVLDMRLALVASSIEDLQRKLGRSTERLADPACRTINDLGGIYFSEDRLARTGTLAFLFPGEGSQYLHMLGDLCVRLPSVRERFDLVDRAFAAHARNVLPSQVIYPPTLPSDDETRTARERRLEAMDFAAEAVFAASQGMLSLLSALGIRPQAVAGHSGGEISALLAAGVIRLESDAQLVEHIIDINELYGRLHDDSLVPSGSAVAVNAVDRETVLAAIQEGGAEVSLAIDNCPNQVVLCGGEADVAAVVERLRNRGALCVTLPFQRPYHTSAFEPYCAEIAPFFDRLAVGTARVPVYSAATARLFPDDPGEIRWLAARQAALPVRFRETVEAMHDDGVRIFIEVGPGGTLTSFVADTLRGRPHLAVAANLPRVSGIRQLNCLLAQLAAHGVGMRLHPLYERRDARRIAFDGPTERADERLAGLVPLAMGLSFLQLKDVPPALQRLPIRDFASFEPSGDRALVELPATASPATIDRAMQAYLASMDRFLTVQQDVMQGYLDRGDPVLATANPHLADIAAISPPPLKTTSELPPNAAPAVNDRDADLPATVLEIIGERTGYPTEMLAPTLDLEADLGIDSIKRIEILSALHRRTGLIGPERMEAAALLKTISQVVAFLNEQSKSAPREFPLIGRIESFREGVSLIALREFDTDRDLFLNDHALGGRVSVSDAKLTGLPLMPLTMTIELMAEAAASLVPGKTLAEMRDIRGSQWLAFDRGRATLRTTAELQPKTGSSVEIQVRVHLIGDAASPLAVEMEDAQIAECVAVFGDNYHEPPRSSIVLHSPRPSKWRPDRLYRDHMFHGPSFRGIETINTWAANGSEAALRVLPRSGLFAAHENPGFLIDPILLDAAGQLVGYWAAEHLATGFNVFPYRVKSLQLFEPLLPAGQQAICRGEMRLVDESGITADFEIESECGIAMRVVGWEDLRVDFPDSFYRMCISPRGVALSTERPCATLHGVELGQTHCCSLALGSLPSLKAHGAIWLRALAQLVLTQREREIWRDLKGSDTRRIEWLLGRCCAKDAVRRLIKDRDLLPADIDIVVDVNGRPEIAEGTAVGVRPAISIAHADGIAVALASGVPDMAVGIDIEHVDPRRDGFEDVAFTDRERALIAQTAEMTDPSRREYAFRFWCAKEAAAKALGYGLTAGPGSLLITEFDTASGTARLKIAGALADRVPAARDTPLVVQTSRQEDVVLAFCFYRRSTDDTI